MASLSGLLSATTMLPSVYDPQEIADDAFDRTNHTGEQAIETVTGLQTALDGKAPDDHDHAIADVTDLQTALDAKAPADDPTLTGDIQANGSTRGVVTAVAALEIDCSLGNYFTKAISGASTFTFANVPASGAYGMTIRVAVTGDVAITWPAAVEWPDDTAPVLSASKTHLFMFVTDNGGTVWRGAALVDYAG